MLGGSAALATRLRSYGADRIPRSGGVVLAFNHFSWIDIPCVGWVCKRNLYFLAKVEAHSVPGLGQLIRSFGTLSVRRGESDREAVRLMREVVRNGNALGVFVEGTRQRSGVPGHVQPGAAMVALQEDVPVVCGAIHGSQTLEGRQLRSRLDRVGRADALRRAAARRQGIPRGVAADRGRAEPALALAARPARGRPAAPRRPAHAGRRRTGHASGVTESTTSTRASSPRRRLRR